MAVASAAGEASAADLAALTDRVLVNCGVRQMYGTQLQACDGGLAALPLVDPDAVDARRASVGLEPEAAYVARVVERHGAPPPARVACRRCGGETEWWPPAPGGTTTVICPACEMRLTISDGERRSSALSQLPSKGCHFGGRRSTTARRRSSRHSITSNHPLVRPELIDRPAPGPADLPSHRQRTTPVARRPPARPRHAPRSP